MKFDMWGTIITTFLFVYLLMIYYIGRRGWTVIGKPLSYRYKILYWGLFLLVVSAFPIAEIGEEFLPADFGLGLTIWGGYSVVGVSYLFFLVGLVDIFRLLDRRLDYIPIKIKEHQKTPVIVAAKVLSIVIAILIYGGWNAQNPIVKNYDLTIDKQAGTLQNLHIAMVSDIHYGAIIEDKRVNKLVGMINELNPDIILIAGDITDGATTSEESRRLTEQLKKLSSKFGTFVVPGNHDRGLRSEDNELFRYFIEAGIHVLKDSQVMIQDNFYVVGRDDAGRQNQQRRKRLEDITTGMDRSLPIFLLDHQPVDLENAQINGVDLQVSGHTHVGQIFPANLVTGRLYELDWGLVKKSNYHLIVSSGFGTWGPPLRIGNNPEVVSINVSFKTR